MRYYSTNHHSPNVTLKDALTRSEAIDGGIYMPERLPSFPQAFFNNIAEMSPTEISYFVANNLFNDDIPSSKIKEIGDKVFERTMPLVEIEPNIFAMELFHGPTKNVKDIALRFSARCISALHASPDRPINVLVASSGNSGQAVANGFINIEGVNVFVLYPKDTPMARIEPIRNLGNNVRTVPVNGNIEDCRSIVANALSDKKLNENYLITCANSINIGRILPQTICFFIAYAMLKNKFDGLNEMKVSVPCGNCGDLLAGYFSTLMGLPISKLVAASNANGSFGKFLEDGKMDMPLTYTHTLAYALDCCRPSNLPRFYDVCNGDLSKLREKIVASSCTDDEIRATIVDVYNRTGYMLDPHSAVAYYGLKKNLQDGEKGVFFATAHPSKFPKLIKELLGKEFEHPVGAACSYKSRGKENALPPTYPAFKKYLNAILTQEK